MKVPYSWLQELVQTRTTVEDLCESLSIAGFEVESLEDLSSKAKGVIVGFVESCEKHPNANKLSVCKVNIGKKDSIQIVCGASNIKNHIHVLVATVGSHLSAINLSVKETEIRGISSSGMICSMQELGIQSNIDGITILEELNYQLPSLGSSANDLLGLNEMVIDLAITANRPDGMSMLGIANEVSALTGEKVNKPKELTKTNTEIFNLGLENQNILEDKGIYSLTKLSNIKKISDTPNWIRNRLINSGIKSINGLVDITNYVMLEQGQPMHAFDADKLEAQFNKPITEQDFGIRKAKKGEAMKLLDGKVYTFENNLDIITCNNEPIAVAGVIGGYESSVSDSTNNIFLEVALFSAKSVRNSSRAIGIRTESSSRYEKGISKKLTLSSVNRYIDLAKSIFSFESSTTKINRPNLETTRIIKLRKQRIDKILGVLNQSYFFDSKHKKNKLFNANDYLKKEDRYIPESIVQETLELIGCVCQKTNDDIWNVEIPPQRDNDLTREIDLIEEIARLVGYDQFESNLPEPIKPGGLNSSQTTERNLRRYLVGAGFQEITTISLVGKGTNETERIKIENPLLAETSYLRTNMWEEHLEIVRRNLASGRESCWVYEIGNIYLTEKKMIKEKKLLTGVLNGKNTLEKWKNNGKRSELDYFEARGKLKEAFSSLKLIINDIKNINDSYLHPGRASYLMLEGKEFGRFGQLHPKVAMEHDIPLSTYVFELDMSHIIQAATRKNKLQPIFKNYPTVPFMERDISLIVDKNCNCAEIISIIKKTGRPFLETVELIDRYSGDNLPAGQVSQAFRIRYRDSKKTLTDDDINPVHEKIRSNLSNKLNAELRS